MYEEHSGLAQGTFGMRISCFTLGVDSVSEGRERDCMI
jgi:hypothetical protein